MTNLNSLAMHIKLTQLRAGFVATYGPLAWGLKPDMVTDSSSPDDVSGAAVAAMSRRFIP